MTEQPAVTRRIAGEIRQLRKSRRLTAAALVEVLNNQGLTTWNRSTLAKLETGRRQTLTVDELEALAVALGVPVASFLTTGCRYCYDNPPSGFTCNRCGLKKG